MLCPDFNVKKMKIDRNYINKILGLDLKEKDIKKYLEKMGLGYNKGTVLIPCYRSDILHRCIQAIARTSQLPHVALYVFQADQLVQLAHHGCQVLLGRLFPPGGWLGERGW